MMKPLLEKGSLMLLLEATAGQGSCVGKKFEELAWILQRVRDLPCGVCIDTCHIFAAGYDLRTKEALDKTLDHFDAVVGLHHLKALHLNDSMKGLGSRVDRHSNLGEGMIGFDTFRYIIESSRLNHLPMYLETPGGPERWKKEIAELKRLYPTSGR
jgi:deoxyribonuclease-4